MRCVLELIPALTYVRAGPDSGPSASSARTAAAGLAVQRWPNGYAVPAGWVIPCVVLVAAAQGCANVREFAS